ncbi:MAG: hypothetical protein ABEJ59_02265 [Halanaeroarchaeum sp.]
MSPVPSALLAIALGRSVDAPRHAAMRQRFRAAGGDGDFRTFLSRVLAASWVAFVVGGGLGAIAVGTLPDAIRAPLLATIADLGLPASLAPGTMLALGGALAGGTVAKVATVRAAGAVLAHRARRRRERIERALPRTVRFMHVLATGTTEERDLLAAVADRQRAFGEVARSFARVLGTATVTGSVDRALRLVARDTPSRQTLAPFLLTFRARAREGSDAVERFLHLESRMLARRDAQRTDEARRYFGLVVRLFVVLLGVPAVAAVAMALAVGLHATDALPTLPVEALFRAEALASPWTALGIVGLGVLASGLVVAVRPPEFRWARYRTADDLGTLVATVARNPANALVLVAPLAVGLALWLWTAGRPATTAAVWGYAAFAVPVGLVDWRRAHIDAAKDRSIPDLIYAVADQVHRGRSFTEAVEQVAADGDLGALDPDVADLAYDLRVAAPDRPVRGAALDRFAERVGTSLAERTVGMIAGALDAGSETAAAFDALQSEAGRLYHEEQAVSDRLSVVLAVGWLVSMLVVGIVVAVDVAALGTTITTTGRPDTVALLGTVGPGTGVGAPGFYLLTQATMLSSGWFAGVAGRGVYEALLHSGALVLAAFLAFAGAGLL